MDPLSVAGTIVGIVGLGTSYLFHLQASKWRDRVRRITWMDLEVGAAELARKAENYWSKTPDVILAVGPRGAIIAYLMMLQFKKEIPIIACVSHLNDEPGQGFPDPTVGKEWEAIQTRRCRVHIPNALYEETRNRVLVVDDWVRSGDMLYAILETLKAHSQDIRSIYSCTIAVTDTALANGKAPMAWVFEVEAKGTFFPWGAAR